MTTSRNAPDQGADEEGEVSIEDHSIIAWIVNNGIVNEKGEPIEFYDHPFLFDIFRDQAQNIAVMKCAQAGVSTCEILRNHYDGKSRRMDIIYTLPTDSDVGVFVSGKVNRIIANNPTMLADVDDKDSIEQKAVGASMVYYRGTWTKKAAIMITGDRLVHDEADSSKQDVVADYQARLQHSKFKQTHIFSHPSLPDVGVDRAWRESDMKEWLIACPDCKKVQHLSWSTTDQRKMSVDLERKAFVCKACRAELSDDVRRAGRWAARKGRAGAKFSGYHISLLMCPWVTAKEIADKWAEVMANRQTEEWFNNKVLGLPFAGSRNKVSRESILGSVRNEEREAQGRIVVGVDTGVKLRYVVGDRAGLLSYGEMEDYEPREKRDGDPRPAVRLEESLEWFLVSFPRAIMVIDQGGDILGARKLQAKYPGRVFLCHYGRDRKTQQLVRWGKGSDATGTVIVDRNRAMQMVVDEFAEGRIGLYNGTESDWYDYWLHWSHIHRVVEETDLGKEFVWLRTDRDDWCHATIYWRVGIEKYGATGTIVGADDPMRPNGHTLDPKGAVIFDPAARFGLSFPEEEDDWRDH